jgi:hypothetical protein
VGEIISLKKADTVDQIIDELKRIKDGIDEIMCIVIHKDKTYTCHWSGGDDYLRKMGMLEVLKLDVHLRKLAENT